MKLSKTLGEILFELFGPNGNDQTTTTGDTRRMAVYKELERHGLVRIEEVPQSQYRCMRRIARVHPAFGKTLCEVFATDVSPLEKRGHERMG